MVRKAFTVTAPPERPPRPSHPKTNEHSVLIANNLESPKAVAIALRTSRFDGILGDAGDVVNSEQTLVGDRGKLALDLLVLLSPNVSSFLL
jgi:hypothetical protein